jgi:hypothetical protein
VKGWTEGVPMLRATTAAMTVMLLQAIFVPIVHKTSLKSAAGEKTLSKIFIVKQLLIYTRYDFTDKPDLSANLFWGMARLYV